MKLSIVHFHPLEMYPPVMNFINFLTDNESKISSVNINTTANILTPDRFYSQKKALKISRSKHPGTSKFILIRFLLLLNFNLTTLIRLVLSKPDIILYYETFSALPVYLYLRYFRFRLKPRLFIHYHEYTTPEEYANMPAWIRYNYNLEKNYVWNLTEKISHTNQYRRDIFEKVQHIDNHKLLVTPNFPPKNWALHQNDKKTELPVKIIYIGSLSFEDTYIKEFTEWVISKETAIQFDIFSYNHKPSVNAFFTENKFTNITFHPNGIYYFNMPSLLQQYQIGVILYKANTENVKYCASNKLFEYLACGLDVWVTDEMTGSYPYSATHVFPKVMMVDFKDLKNFNVTAAISKQDLPYKPSDYFCETVNSEIIEYFHHAKR